MTDLLYSQLKPNEQKNSFQGIGHVFFKIRLWVFVILNAILNFFEVLLIFWSDMAWTHWLAEQ